MRVAPSAMLLAWVFAWALVGAAEPLRTTVEWADASGSGTADFQGVVADGVLTGQLDFAGQTLVVVGTVGPEGEVEGEIQDQNGGEVGTFETTLVEGELSGDFTVTGWSSGVWVTATSEPRPVVPEVAD